METTEVSGALELTERVGLGGAHEHIQTALTLFGKRPDPDYRNSIKESISAVKSIAGVLGKEDSKGLAGALTALCKRTPIHGALKAAFVQLYGYTSISRSVARRELRDELHLRWLCDHCQYPMGFSRWYEPALGELFGVYLLAIIGVVNTTFLNVSLSTASVFQRDLLGLSIRPPDCAS